MTRRSFRLHPSCVVLALTFAFISLSCGIAPQRSPPPAGPESSVAPVDVIAIAPAATPTTEPGPAPATPPPAEIEDAEIEDGTWQHPFTLPLDAVTIGNTERNTTAVAAHYSCAPTIDESGNEIVYTFRLPSDGVFTAALNDVPGDSVDVDVHVLSEGSPDACLQRHNIKVSAALTAGHTYWLVVDTFVSGGLALSGEFRLDVRFYPDVPDESTSCPPDMVLVPGDAGLGQRASCMDRYEAPNTAGASPLVMYDFTQASAWCEARSKRLCYDDEWTRGCSGQRNDPYPYGAIYDPLACNTAQSTVAYSEALIGAWPAQASGPSVQTFEELVARAQSSAPAAAEHIKSIYRATPSGSFSACTNDVGAYDTAGNVEEWTRRRDGGVVVGGLHFSGNLKGRFWSQVRTCQQDLKAHADPFRYYEIGFRCCADNAAL